MQYLVAKYSPSGALIAAGDANGGVSVLNSSDLSVLARNESHFSGINDVSWSPEGKYIISAGDDTVVKVWLWTGTELKLLKSMTGHRAPVTSARMNMKGTLVVSTSVDRSVRLWDLVRGQCFKTMNAHSDPVVTADISYDGSVVVTASHDGSIRVWSMTSGRCLRSIPGSSKREPLVAAAFTPNAQYIACMVNTGEIYMVDYVAERWVKHYVPKQPRKDGITRGIVFWQQSLIVGAPDGVRLWNVQTMKLEKLITFKKAAPQSLDIHGDSLLIVLDSGNIEIKQLS